MGGDGESRLNVVWIWGRAITLENWFLTVALDAKLVGKPAGMLFLKLLKLEPAF